MKPTNHSFAFAAAVLLMACGNQPNSFTVTGNVNNFHSVYGEGNTIDTVYIQCKDSIISEKVAVAPDGTFTLTGAIDAPSEAYLTVKFTTPIGTGESMLLLVLENGTISINDFQKGDIQGTPLNDAVYAELSYLKQANDCSTRKLQRLSAFIEEYKQTPASVALIYYMAMQEALTIEELATLIDGADPCIKEHKFINAYTSHIQRELKKKALTATTSEGCMFTDFEAEYNGKVQRLSDYVGRGQYVLADFWASWCGPCRQEIPGLIEIHKLYKDKGLVVLGITVNDQPEHTDKAIKEFGIPYPQIMNGGHTPAKTYGITGIPHIILFGPDGTILKRGLRGEAIKQVVNEYMAR